MGQLLRHGITASLLPVAAAPLRLRAVRATDAARQPFDHGSSAVEEEEEEAAAWLVLRPGDGTWKPWGRLECWHESGAGTAGDSLGYHFELLLPDPTGMGAGMSVAESSIPASRDGQFTIDPTASQPFGRSGSPGCNPRGSSDLGGYGLWPFGSYHGFVMLAAVQGEGRCSRPTVEVKVPHVGCAEDAAAFVALAAAVDLSMDACRLFSHHLRREISNTCSELGR